jgi:phenylalanyl-tRNA synthetase beta chain
MHYLCHLLSTNNSTINKGQIDYIKELENRLIDVNIQRVNSIIGQNINSQKIENILTSLGFTQANSKHSILSKIIPANRHDIINIADVTEEIVRIIGIDNIKAQPLIMEELNNRNEISHKLSKKYKLRSAAISNSFFETITYVFASRELLKKYDFQTVSQGLDILNPINNDLNTFRTTLLLNLISAVSSNEKQGFKSISLYEMGNIFNQQREESFKLAFVQSDLQEEESLENKAKPKKVDLFSFAQNISNCIGEFELETAENINDKFLHPYQCANIIQNKKNIGIISKIHPSVAIDFGISSDTFVSQIDFELLNDDLIKAKNISKFQNSKKDLSIVAPKSLAYKEIKKVINNIGIIELKQFNLIDIYSDEALGEKESLTIKFVLQSDKKTLEDDDIVTIMNNIQDELKNKLDLELR